jgi:hypothetical protein
MASTRVAFKGSLILSVCGLLMLVGSCAKVSEHRLLERCSPDGSFCASVSLASSSSPLDSDVYYLRVRSEREVWHWSHWANFGKGERVLTTVEIKPTRLIWLSDDLLEVHCDACKINGGDVEGEKTRSGPVSIRFVGFDTSS